MSITLKELADFCGARIEGGDPSATIHSAAEITSAHQGQVTQLTNSRYTRHIKDSTASACFIAEGFGVENVPEGMALLICPDPEVSFIKAVELLHPARIYGGKLRRRQCLKLM
jgi:UDP-3-O-[3-hydroxymyristoyl] glucosamine N-acyltransferase, LpxD.